jgi:oligopeptide/dipeptide ABC transporter ATP-binding protein
VSPPSASAPLVTVEGLVKHFATDRGARVLLHAVNDVSFSVGRGETLALVGESGSGKTTVARCLVRLVEPDAGAIRFDGVDLGSLRGRALRAFRRRMQIVFQDPYGSLNPRMTAGRAVAEPLAIHRIATGRDADQRVVALFREVGLDPSYRSRYPHQLSGGQRQRVGIARALAPGPEFLVLDEPVSALDVSVQAQVLVLLRELQQQRGLTYLFIAHDLAVVRQVASHVAVMYLGRIVEQARAEQLFTTPRHPYTAALLSAVPVPDPAAARTRIALRGEPPSPVHPPAGCPLHARCPHPAKDERCRTELPLLRAMGEDQQAACHHAAPTA